MAAWQELEEPALKTIEAECEADEALARHMEACEERYGRYLALCDSMEGGAAAGRRAAS